MCLFGCAGSCACWVYKVMCLFGYVGSCACWCMQVYVPVQVPAWCAGSCACWVYKVMCLFGYAGSCACWCIQVYEPVVVCLFGCTGPCACWSMLIAGVCTCWGVQGHVPVLCAGSCACCVCRCMYLLGCTRSRICLGAQVHVPVGVCTCWGVHGHVPVCECRFNRRQGTQLEHRDRSQDCHPVQRPPRPHPEHAVQPQVHDDGYSLYQHGEWYCPYPPSLHRRTWMSASIHGDVWCLQPDDGSV